MEERLEKLKALFGIEVDESLNVELMIYFVFDSS